MTSNSCLILIPDPCAPESGCMGGLSITDIPNFTWGDLQKVASNNVYVEAQKSWTRANSTMKAEFQRLFLQLGGKWNAGNYKQTPTPQTTDYVAYPANTGVSITNKATGESCGMKALNVEGVRIRLNGTGDETLTFNVLYFDGENWEQYTCQRVVKKGMEITVPLGVVSYGDAIIWITEPFNGKKYAAENGNSCGCGGKPKKDMRCGSFSPVLVTTDLDGYYESDTSNGTLLPFSPVISCGCQLDSFFCENADMFAPIALMALEVELLNMRLNNARITWFAAYGKTEADKRRNELKEEIAAAMIGAANAMFQKYSREGSCGCIECGRTKFVTQI